MLAYLSTADRIGSAGLLLAVVVLMIFAVRTGPPLRPAPRKTRTIYVDFTPTVRKDPRSNVRPLGPRPFDWATDVPELARPPRGIAVVAPLDAVIDETFPDGPAWEHLGQIANVDPAAFVFVKPAR